jgi:hypothetical protein
MAIRLRWISREGEIAQDGLDLGDRRVVDDFLLSGPDRHASRATTTHGNPAPRRANRQNCQDSEREDRWHSDRTSSATGFSLHHETLSRKFDFKH